MDENGKKETKKEIVSLIDRINAAGLSEELSRLVYDSNIDAFKTGAHWMLSVIVEGFDDPKLFGDSSGEYKEILQLLETTGIETIEGLKSSFITESILRYKCAVRGLDVEEIDEAVQDIASAVAGKTYDDPQCE